MANINSRWTETQIVLALNLYSITPYSRISPKNPEIIDLADLLGRTPGAVSFKLSNLAACDQKGQTLGHKGSSHGSKLDALVWNKYLNGDELDLERLNSDAEKIKHDLLKIKSPDQTQSHSESCTEDNTSNGQERSYLLNVRLKQNLFRRAVLANYDSRCPFSGCAIPQLIDAAHILPWKDYPYARMMVSNGLALNKLIHVAYDKNLLGIDPDGRVVVSDLLLANVSGEPCRDFFVQIKDRCINFNQLRFRPNQDFLHERFKHYQEAHQ